MNITKLQQSGFIIEANNGYTLAVFFDLLARFDYEDKIRAGEGLNK